MDSKNLLFFIILAIIFPFIFFNTNNSQTDTNNNNGKKQIDKVTIAYDIIKYNFKSFEPDVQILEKENNYWISICLGEKKTGGYDLKIDKVTIINKKVIIELSVKQNSKYVTQAFSYPNITVSIPKLDIEFIEVYIYENKIPFVLKKKLK